MGTVIQEFRAFAARGNVVELAVAVVVGAAFGGVTTSLVNDILMPVVGLIVGNADFANLEIVLRQATETRPAVTLGYGRFINACVNFGIIAAAMFLLVKGINRLKRNTAAPAEGAPPAAPPRQEALLEEIRDLLKAERPEK